MPHLVVLVSKVGVVSSSNPYSPIIFEITDFVSRGTAADVAPIAVKLPELEGGWHPFAAVKKAQTKRRDSGANQEAQSTSGVHSSPPSTARRPAQKCLIGEDETESASGLPSSPTPAGPRKGKSDGPPPQKRRKADNGIDSGVHFPVTSATVASESPVGPLFIPKLLPPAQHAAPPPYQQLQYITKKHLEDLKARIDTALEGGTEVNEANALIPPALHRSGLHIHPLTVGGTILVESWRVGPYKNAEYPPLSGLSGSQAFESYVITEEDHPAPMWLVEFLGS